MMNASDKSKEKSLRRTLGIHLTSQELFLRFIFPRIKDYLHDFIWIDLYAGEGNLILPILDFIDENKRCEYFQEHVFLSDIQAEMVEKCVSKAMEKGIPEKLARRNIIKRDNLASFPEFLKNKDLPLYHVTNPPYLYLGYIRKHHETRALLHYFERENKGYQDLYQIAMMNDLRNNIENLIYIIPTNFIFGASVSNKIRLDFLKYYNIDLIYIFESKVFKHTGTNICIAFFTKKKFIGDTDIIFNGIKIKKGKASQNRQYVLKKEFKYRAGMEFFEFLQSYRSISHINVRYYLLKKDVVKNKGTVEINAIDSSEYNSNKYSTRKLFVNESLANLIKSNILYLRTVDSGSIDKRVGLSEIKQDFGVDAIYVSKNTYRTSPIHVFFDPSISKSDQLLLKKYFNFMLEYFRKKLDSEFLTTYKYSDAEYTRKYLGLTQARALIQTLPILSISQEEKYNLESSIHEKDVKSVLKLLSSHLRGKRKRSRPLSIDFWIKNEE